MHPVIVEPSQGLVERLSTSHHVKKDLSSVASSTCRCRARPEENSEPCESESSMDDHALDRDFSSFSTSPPAKFLCIQIWNRKVIERQSEKIVMGSTTLQPEDQASEVGDECGHPYQLRGNYPVGQEFRSLPAKLIPSMLHSELETVFYMSTIGIAVEKLDHRGRSQW